MKNPRIILLSILAVLLAGAIIFQVMAYVQTGAPAGLKGFANVLGEITEPEPVAAEPMAEEPAAEEPAAEEVVVAEEEDPVVEEEPIVEESEVDTYPEADSEPLLSEESTSETGTAETLTPEESTTANPETDPVAEPKEDPIPVVEPAASSGSSTPTPAPTPVYTLPDTDGDDVLNAQDNCPNTPNTDQRDMDKDGKGNACDSDNDNDGVPNEQDQCIWTFNATVNANGCVSQKFRGTF